MVQGEIAQARKLVMPLTKPANEREVRGAAYSILGRCAYVKTRYFNTIRLLKKARSLGDASVETFLTLGLAYEASATKARWFRVKGNLELANQTFKLARASHADNELISIANANIAFQQHKWLRAIKILEPHVADSKNPLLFTIYSESLRRAGQVEEANSFLLRSCSQEITADVLLAIVMRYHNNGEFPAAHSVLKVCSDRFPESVESELFVALDTTVCLGDMLFNFLPEFRKKAEQRSATITELENHVVETRSLRQLNGLYKEITRYVTNEPQLTNASTSLEPPTLSE
jgi:tetratricopeptide (TPR) repeat protein